jgi:catalase
MPEKEASTVPYNPFDLTKVWPHKDYPLIDVGYFELNRNPDNYFSDVEQAAFSPANIVPGIGFSPDKMLQGRLFSYGDTQRYRLGINHYQIPVNAPRCPFHNYHRDGAMRVDGNSSNTVTYEPNSAGMFQEQPDYSEPPLSIEGAADHWNHREDEDYFSQPRALYELLDDAEHQRMFQRLAGELIEASEETQKRQIELFKKVHPEYGAGVEKALNALK